MGNPDEIMTRQMEPSRHMTGSDAAYPGAQVAGTTTAFAPSASELRLGSRLTLLGLELLSVLSRRLEKHIAKLIVRRLGGECLSSVGLLLKRFLCHEAKIAGEPPGSSFAKRAGLSLGRGPFHQFRPPHSVARRPCFVGS